MKREEEHIARRLLSAEITRKRRRERGKTNGIKMHVGKTWQWQDWERGRCNKQGSMSEESEQLYRRPEMTEQAWKDEED